MEQKNKFYKNILTYKTGKVNAKIPRDKKKFFPNAEGTYKTRNNRWEKVYIDAKKNTLVDGAWNMMYVGRRKGPSALAWQILFG